MPTFNARGAVNLNPKGNKNPGGLVRRARRDQFKALAEVVATCSAYMATYHQDAAGQIIELFAELDRMSDESLGYFDPKPSRP